MIYRIGESTIELEILGAGIRRGALPTDASKLHGHSEIFTPPERNDFQAFEAAGWKFLEGGNLDWRRVQDLNHGRFSLGVLARRPEGGLVIVQNRLTLQLDPDSPLSKPNEIVERYPRTWTLEHLKNIIEVEFKISESKIEDSIKLELDILAESLQGKVLLAEPSILYHVHPSGQLLQGEPAPQWQWDLIELKEAWQEANSMGAGVQVAVIDRGFYYDDSEIKSAISWRSGLNDDGGFIPIDLMPLGDHGAFCAGLVGARLDRMDVNGVAPECELILATIPRHGVISQNLLAKLIILCADPSRYDLNHIRGADVISCSLGPTGGNWKLGFMMRQAIDFANSSGRAHSGGRGTPVVWAVFNTDKVIEATSIEGYRGVISVSQCDRSSRRVSSGWGPALDLVAPGYGVVGIQWGVNGKAIDYGYGSSLAAPCVAGVAALVMAVNPDLSSNEIADILTCSCDPPSKVKVRNDDTGWGRLNAKEAVRQAKSLGAQLDPLQC